MPLRATLDGEVIQSFRLEPGEWSNLKGSYKSKSLLMPCCQTKAIPKTSKLGTQYFAHSKRGGCASNPETQEHLYLKYLIAQIAHECGWQVTTEYAGVTPDGDEWVADVFCEKGKAKLAFEVQWSQQTNDEYLRRTAKYASAGVRCAWLFRLKGGRQHFRSEFLESYGLPYFGFRCEAGGYTVARYDTPVDVFVKDVLEGKLAWAPRVGDSMVARVCYLQDTCWKCKKPVKTVTSLFIMNSAGEMVSSLSFTDKRVAGWIADHIPKSTLWERGIGTIRERYSKTAGGKYISNGCIHCDALQGNFYVAHELDGVAEFIDHEWKYAPGELPVEPSWFFNGSDGKLFY